MRRVLFLEPSWGLVYAPAWRTLAEITHNKADKGTPLSKVEVTIIGAVSFS